MIKDFIKGMSYIVRGTQNFFHDQESWKYALFPLGFLIVIYFVIFWKVIDLSNSISTKINQHVANLPDWLTWLNSVVSGLSHFLGIVVALLIIGMTICTLYEMFGGFFFDSLVDHYETRKYGPPEKPVTWSMNLKYCIGSVLFGLQTALALGGLFVVSLFLPVIGQILLIICMGYFLGLSYIVCSANRNGTTIAQLKKAAAKKSFIILGFGIPSYFLLMIPFAAIIFLPCLVLGGSELFNNELKEYV